MLETPTIPELTPPPAAGVPVPNVRAGSHVDAKAMRARIQQLLAGIDRADEQLSVLCQAARDRKIYMLLEDPRGRYFTSWSDFCVAPVPWGLGLHPAMVEEVVKEQRDPKRRARLALEGPLLLQTRAAPRKGRTARVPARGQEYSLQRLKRDRPDLLTRVATGELTIQAAAEQAGHRPPFTSVLVEPMAIARVVVSRLDEAQQRELLDLIRHPEQITDPGHGTNPHWEAYLARTLGPEGLARRRAEAKRARAAERAAYEAAYREQRRATRGAQARALGLPSLAGAGP